MAKNLVIVESPAKAKTIQGYLGKDYSVIATVGHLIDLPKRKLGVVVEKNYEMVYETIKGKDKTIKDIKKAVKSTTDTVYLAQDPDREGESIAWQVAKLCKFPSKSNKVRRAVFHEITKEAINGAIQDTREIDADLVEAQQSRRILDRLIGFKLSPLVAEKILPGLSAGRVQSVALRLIVEREEEIQAFIPTPYMTFTAKYAGSDVIFTLVDKKGNIVKASPEQGGELKKLLDEQSEHTVTEHKTKKVTNSPSAPLTTSTMQQTANKLYGFPARMTMQIAQELYQGINVKEHGGLLGLITYMRTDSVNLSDQAIEAIRKQISTTYGKNYVNEAPRRFKTKSRSAQEAHEAIRPTHVELTPDMLEEYLTPVQHKLYSLIWRRAVATQMKPQIMEEENVKAIPKVGNAHDFMTKENWAFEAVALREIFDGFKILKSGDEKEVIPLPKVSVGDDMTVKEIISKDLMTTPRSRYNEATLIKEMERLGIGRPSTYAAIISTIVYRKYVVLEQKFLVPTEIGTLVCNFLKKHFLKIVDYDFTAAMEKDLDEIAAANLTKKKMLDSFYPEFAKSIEEKRTSITKEALTDLGETDKECRVCGTKMRLKIGPWGKYYLCPNPDCNAKEPYVDLAKYVIPKEAETEGYLLKKGRFGLYWAHPNYPEVKKTIPAVLKEDDNPLDMEKYFIPEEITKEGYVLKRGRFGIFWAHPDYPEVKKTQPVLLKELCPECGSHLTEKQGKLGRTFIGCSAYPTCQYIQGRKGGYVKKMITNKKTTSSQSKTKTVKSKTTKTVTRKRAAKPKTNTKRTK